MADPIGPMIPNPNHEEPNVQLAQPLRLFGLAMAVAAVVALPATAGTLVTTNSPHDDAAAVGTGLFFNLTPSRDLALTGLGVYAEEGNSPANLMIDVYYRQGSYVGSQTTVGNWSRLQNFDQAPNGFDVIDALIFGTPLTVTGGQTYGFYVVALAGGLQWSDENFEHSDSNADLTLTIETASNPGNGPNGTRELFAVGNNFRQFVGSVSYREAAQAPEPSTLALAGLALAGIGMSMRRRQLARGAS